MSFLAIGVTSAAISTGLGVYTTVKGQQAQSKAQKALEEQARNSPLYKPDKSIDTYYQEAMNRYKENPYQSQQYQVGQQNIQRATTQGISALQDRRSAIGGIGRLQANQMGAMQNLGAQAEASRQQRLGQFGQATQLKSGDYQRQFDINQMTPYNRQLQLEQMKAAAAGERYNAGMQMMGQGVSSIGSLAGAGAFKGGGKVNTSTVNTDLGFGGTTGSPYGKFTDSYSPKIDYSKYWKPTKI
jgi:hypothetical protein